MPHEKNLSLLIISDKAETAGTINKTLSHIYTDIKITATDSHDISEDQAADIIIVDGAGTTKSKLDHLLDRLPDCPILVVVEGINDVRNFRYLMQGRRELITRDSLGTMALAQSIHHLIERQKLHEQLTKTSLHLKELSIRDEMTHLYNHRHFNEILTQEVKKSVRYRRPLGLVMIALKNFTAINEGFGHHEGDRLLSRSAGVIVSTVREVDITARYGDNEFAVILPETNDAATLIAGERIYEALSKLTITDGEKQHPVEVSVGLSSLTDKIKTKEELLKAALHALIEAKRCRKHAIRSANEMAGAENKLTENTHLIETLHERMESIALRVENGYFQEVMKLFSEIPMHRRYLNPHAERVSFFSERLAAKLKVSEDDRHQIRHASLLHDIGLLAIDQNIINKPSQLTIEEMKLVQQHPVFGTRIMGNSKLMQSEPEIVLHHHERYDGTGYPEGLKGSKIPLGARIVAITEAWDVMISSQPYRTEPLQLDRALAELKSGAGAQFDPELVEIFLGLITG